MPVDTNAVKRRYTINAGVNYAEGPPLILEETSVDSIDELSGALKEIFSNEPDASNIVLTVVIKETANA